MDDKFQILEVNVNGLVHQLSVALDRSTVDARVSDRLKVVQRTLQVKGFRRGKAPLNVIRRYHGRQIVEAIVDRLAIDIAQKLIVEQHLLPVGRPIINFANSSIDTEARIHFTLTVEVFPQVAVKSIDGIRVERLKLVSINSEVGVNTEDGAELHFFQKLLRQHVNSQILDQLATDYDFAVPAELVKREHKRIRSAYRHTVEDYVSPKLERKFSELAERRIRLAILLVEIGRRHNICIPREEVEKLVKWQAEREPEHEKEIVNYYLENQTALTELQSTLLESRIIEFILQRASIHEREVTADELVSLFGERIDGDLSEGKGVGALKS